MYAADPNATTATPSAAQHEHMQPRTSADIADELYARGYAGTRAVADRMVTEDPQGIAELLHRIHGAEMAHADDRASISEWGSAGTGT